jgi:hypothetical protein
MLFTFQVHFVMEEDLNDFQIYFYLLSVNLQQTHLNHLLLFLQGAA